MIKTKKSFSILNFGLGAILIIFWACSDKKSQVLITESFENLIQDTLILSKDLNTAAISPSLAYFETDSGRFLLDFRKLHLVGYRYPEGNKGFEKFYQREGPDGLGDTDYKRALTKDGIFVIDADRKIHQANFEGKVIQSWNLPSTPTDRLYSNYTVFPNNPITYYENEIIIPDVPYVMNEKLIGYEDWLVRLNLNSEEWEYISFEYPEKLREFYEDPNLGPYSHYYNSKSNQAIISFPVVDSLMILENNQTRWIDASPQESLIFKKGKTVPSGEYTIFQPDHSSARYTWITFDPFQKVYLRQVITGLKENESNSNQSYISRIIVLDEDFKKLGEIENLPNTYQGFPTPDGYYFYLGSGEVEEKVKFARVNFSSFLKP